jgi:hypothetical protein
MEQKITRHVGPSSDLWERLEGFVREHIQRCIQTLLEEEVTACLVHSHATFCASGARSSQW